MGSIPIGREGIGKGRRRRGGERGRAHVLDGFRGVIGAGSRADEVARGRRGNGVFVGEIDDDRCGKRSGRGRRTRDRGVGGNGFVIELVQLVFARIERDAEGFWG